jgi:hypothetical protein
MTHHDWKLIHTNVMTSVNGTIFTWHCDKCGTTKTEMAPAGLGSSAAVHFQPWTLDCEEKLVENIMES